MIVSGIAGSSIREQKRCLPTTPPYGCQGEWASIYSADQESCYIDVVIFQKHHAPPDVILIGKVNNLADDILALSVFRMGLAGKNKLYWSILIVEKIHKPVRIFE